MYSYSGEDELLLQDSADLDEEDIHPVVISLPTLLRCILLLHLGNEKLDELLCFTDNNRVRISTRNLAEFEISSKRTLAETDSTAEASVQDAMNEQIEQSAADVVVEVPDEDLPSPHTATDVIPAASANNMQRKQMVDKASQTNSRDLHVIETTSSDDPEIAVKPEYCHAKSRSTGR